MGMINRATAMIWHAAHAVGRMTAATPAYDAAGSGRRLQGWNPGSEAMNSIILGSGEALRSRAHDMVRKNPFASNYVDTYVANAIGTGIRPRAMHGDADVRLALQEAWIRFADESDADGCTNIYGQQCTAVRALVEGGDSFVRMRPRRAEDGLTVPFQLQVLEGEMVPLHKSEITRSGNAIRGGVEFNAIGQRVAYHIHKHHPGDINLFAQGAGELVRVPAAHVLHLFKPLRPGQVRGVTWLANILLRLYELDQYQDAELTRKKIAAMISGFITQIGDETGNPLGAGVRDATDATVEIQKLEPGTFPILQQGEDVKFAGTTDLGQGFTDFNRWMSLALAVGGGITYEQLTGDLSSVNYSSIRAGLLEFRRKVEQFQRTVFIHQFCRPVWRRFVHDAALAGIISASDFRRDPAAFQAVKWVTPGWQWVDPEKEIKAIVKAIRAGLMSRADAVATLGVDIEILDAAIADDNARADGLGLSFDSDGRRPEKGGADGGGRAPAPKTDEADEDEPDNKEDAA